MTHNQKWCSFQINIRCGNYCSLISAPHLFSYLGLLAALQWFLNLDLPLLSSFTSSCTTNTPWVRALSLLLTALSHNPHLTSKGFDLVFPSSCWHSSHFICNNVSSATLQTSSLAPSLSPLLGFWSCFTFLPCAVCVNMSWITGCTTTLSCPPRGNSPLSGPFSSSILLHLLCFTSWIYVWMVPSETNSLL